MMFCPKCGKDNKDDARFCAYCGMAIAGKQPPTSSRRVATRCSICGKELSPSEVRFAPSTGFNPCCSICVDKTVSGTDRPKADDDAVTKAERRAKAYHRLYDALKAAGRVTNDEQARKAYEEVLFTGRSLRDGVTGELTSAKPITVTNDEQARKAYEEVLLAGRSLRDGVTGELTSAKPMPDLTTEAGMAEFYKEHQQNYLIAGEEAKRMTEEKKRLDEEIERIRELRRRQR
jgi:hypothetical protein